MPPTHELTSITNPFFFPDFDSLPNEGEYDEDYYTGSSYKKKWVLLGEIIHANNILRPRIVAQDRNGNKFVVALYLDNRADGARVSRRFKVGYTVVLMQPIAHMFLDATVGVRIEAADAITVFPCKLSAFVSLNADAIQHNWFVDASKSCHACGKVGDKMMRCGACKVAFYCSKDCQSSGWKEKGHNVQCKVLKNPDVMYLFQLDYETYGEGFGFGPGVWKGRHLSAEEEKELESLT